MSTSFKHAKPGDLILADDWNSMQDGIVQHTHKGGTDGALIDGSAIAPSAAITVQQVTTTGPVSAVSLDVGAAAQLKVDNKGNVTTTGAISAATFSTTGALGSAGALSAGSLNVGSSSPSPLTVDGAGKLTTTGAVNAGSFNAGPLNNSALNFLLDYGIDPAGCITASSFIITSGAVIAEQGFGALGGQFQVSPTGALQSNTLNCQGAIIGGGSSVPSTLGVGGNVGINYFADAPPLVVTGQLTSSMGAEFHTNDGLYGIGIGSDTLYATGTAPDQNLNLNPRGNGSVGIGTTTPDQTYKLDVNGSAHVSGALNVGPPKQLVDNGNVYTLGGQLTIDANGNLLTFGGITTGGLGTTGSVTSNDLTTNTINVDVINANVINASMINGAVPSGSGAVTTTQSGGVIKASTSPAVVAFFQLPGHTIAHLEVTVLIREQSSNPKKVFYRAEWGYVNQTVPSDITTATLLLERFNVHDAGMPTVVMSIDQPTRTVQVTLTVVPPAQGGVASSLYVVTGSYMMT